MTRGPDDMAGNLARHLPPPAPAEPGCPDEATLAALAEDRLPAAVRAAVERHLVACDACRVALRWGLEAAGERTPGAQPASRRSIFASTRTRQLLAVAALLVVGLAVGLRWLGNGKSPAGPEDADARLIAAARDLATAEPDLFGGFAPLGPQERRALPRAIERGALQPLAPVHTILARRPEFRWIPEPGAATYEVRLATDQARTLWTRTATQPRLPFPVDVEPLAPGAYVWTVTAPGLLGGTTEARRGFTVATDAQVEAHARAVAAVERAPEELRHLLLAHWALRRGLLLEAERHARLHVAGAPQEAVGRETLVHVLRALGDPEAETLVPPDAPPR